MPLSKSYSPRDVESRLVETWQRLGVYRFDAQSSAPVYSIDTPPPTVSGNLHLGHVYSYTHTDLMARFWRMRGFNVFYPMGFDDNGLPTERLVEKRLHITAQQVGRQAFIQKCLEVSEAAEKDYRELWQRLGLSIDWQYAYRTIDERSRRISQRSFIDLYQNGLAYRKEAPAIWCPECQTAIAQAELDDLDRESEFVTLKFRLLPSQEDGEQGKGEHLLIATTRPELLPACVAIFIHPDDSHYTHLAGRQAIVPLFGQAVPILTDPAADPAKGTGAVMCCTFGDTSDVAWWYTHQLPLVQAIGRDGRLTAAAQAYAGLPVPEARRAIKANLEASGLLVERQPTRQSVRVHERCDTPVEYVVARQWFIQILPHKQALIAAGDQVKWHPEHMHARYRLWVENLSWDWCISRQRYFGVPFPVWYCHRCGEVALAEPEQLPVDPLQDRPRQPCSRCRGSEFIPEEDIFDTWATSSMTPQIVGHAPEGGPDSAPNSGSLFGKMFPFSLRPQAHEIIRTWAFYTIAKSHFHYGQPPWKNALISGWGLAGEGAGKISKSRGGGPLPPLEMILRYSADAVRYWAASTSPGKDSIISEEKIQMGAKLVTKLWNVARFAERFIIPLSSSSGATELTPADRWILSRTQRLVRRVTDLLETYEYASAKSEVEVFFWGDLADNYLEMSKQRLYDPQAPTHLGSRQTLTRVLIVVLKLFAPFLPFVTEEIFQGLFVEEGESRIDIRDSSAETHETGNGPGLNFTSIHNSPWPDPDPTLEDDSAESLGALLVEIATAVRRYKSEHSLSLGSELDRLQLAFTSSAPGNASESLKDAVADLRSITRAREIEIVSQLDPALHNLAVTPILSLAIDIHQ